MKLPGFATREGTDRYRRRFDGKIPREHFRSMNGLWTSSIGIGTNLGNHDDATDKQYREAFAPAVESGCNTCGARADDEAMTTGGGCSRAGTSS